MEEMSCKACGKRISAYEAATAGEMCRVCQVLTERMNEKEDKRTPLDEVFLEAANVFSKRATCPRASVGAVLVRGGVILAQGWNGAPRKMPHCDDVGCDIQVIDGRQSCQRAIHAEANAIFNAARAGASTLGSVLYVTHAPCKRCTDIISQTGVARVVYGLEYGISGVETLRQRGVLCDRIDCLKR